MNKLGYIIIGAAILLIVINIAGRIGEYRCEQSYETDCMITINFIKDGSYE